MVRISDMQILDILRNNAKMKNTEIARKLGVSEAAVRKRIERMEKAGIIKGYYAEIDVKKIGFKIKAVIGVDATPERYTEVIEKLRNEDAVKSMHISSGDHMIMIECWFKNQKELSNYVRNINRMRGITKTCPAIIIDRIK